MGSLERRVVAARMAHVGTLGRIAKMLRTRKATVLAAHHNATVLIAESLGWQRDELAG